MKALTTLLLTGMTALAVKGLDNRLEISHFTVKGEKLPEEFDNFKIILLSDIHCDKTAGIAEAVNSEAPDIICIPGDMTHDRMPYNTFLSLLSRLLKIAPVYLSSGNHDIWRTDYSQFVKECKNLGAIFLQNEKQTIKRDDAQISIYGIEDPFARMSEVIEKNLADCLEYIETDENFGILLFHRANLFDLLSDKGFDLILSGHMHGGQIRIPKIGGMVCPKTNFISNSGIIFPRYLAGEYESNQTKMIVTRGIGNPTILPRLFNRPEICSITLKKQ